MFDLAGPAGVGLDGASMGATGEAMTPPQPQPLTTGLPQSPNDVPQQETVVQQVLQPQDQSKPQP